MRVQCALAWLSVLGTGCAGVGQDGTSVPLFVAGADVSESVVAAFDVQVTIDRADLAFGPLYLCAGASAGDLCDTARLEWLETIVIDTTDPEPGDAGELTGVTGTVRSWMYDLGISSQLTRSQPFVLDAAKELGGASLVLEGLAVVDGVEIPFGVSVPIQQTGDTELGVPVIRKGTSETFLREVTAQERGLVVRFDPSAWVQGVNFLPYVGSEGCSEGGPSIVCEGVLERTCEGETELSTRDCADTSRVCVPGQGCRERLTIEDDSEAYRSVRNALMSGGRPAFEWDYVR